MTDRRAGTGERGGRDTEGSTGEPWSILSRGVGRWRGRETMTPAPWAPEGRTSTGHLTARLVLGGRGLSSDYRQELEGRVTLRSHTLLHWDGGAGGFVLRFTTDAGGEATVLRGWRKNDGLVFEGQGPEGPMRQTFRWEEDRMEVGSEAPAPDGEGWVSTFEALYRPVPGPHEEPGPGAVPWRDLTVEGAPEVRDFYRAVVGWTPSDVSMGAYDDYMMHAADGSGVAGVCHARGPNADLPPVWLIYVVVEDLDRSLATAEERGGEVVAAARSMGESRMAVVRDPAGAMLALYQP